MENKKKINIVIVFIAFVMCFNFFVNRWFDTYYYRESASLFDVIGTEDYTITDEDGGVFLNSISDDKAIISNSEIGLIKDGEYQIEVQYDAKEEGSVLRVYSSNYTNQDNTFGKEFVNIELDKNNASVILDFSIDQAIDDFTVAVETTDENFALGRVSIKSYGYVFNDAYAYSGLVILLAGTILFIVNTKKQLLKPAEFNSITISSKRYTLFLFFVMISAVIISCIPLFNGEILHSDDLPFHLARIEGITRGLESGQFPVKVYGGHLNDYGYPNGIFYPDLLLYFPAVLNLLGVSLFTSYKFYIILTQVLGFIIGYIAFSKLLNSRNIGILVSVIYLLAPYKLNNLYARSAVGEYTAMIFLPLVLYGLYAVLHGKRKDWPWLVIGATGVFQSHILTTGIIAGFAVIFCLVSFKNIFFKEKRIKELLLAVISCIILNLWYIVPFFTMMIQLGISATSRNIYLSEKITDEVYVLFSSLYSRTEVSDPKTMTYSSIGWIAIIAIGLYIVYRIIYKKTDENKSLIKIGDMLLVSGVVSLFLTTNYFAWDFAQSIPLVLKIVGAIQFASRLSVISSVCLSALVGVTVLLWIKNQNYKVLVSVILISVLAVQTSIWYDGFFAYDILGENVKSKSEVVIYMDVGKCISNGEYITNGTSIADNLATPQIISTNETVEFSNLEKHGTKMSFNYTADLSNGQTTLILPYTYIPNYVITVDGQEVPSIKYEGAKVAFNLESETGFVEVQYQGPTTFKIVEFISFAFAVFSVGYYYYKKRKNIELVKNKA